MCQLVVIVAQHQRGFFIANLAASKRTRVCFFGGEAAEKTHIFFCARCLPSVIPVDESPALNQVLNMQGKIKGQYVKNPAFKWCSFKDGKVSLIFHYRPKEKGGASKYQLYSLDVENQVVSMIDSLPFDKPYFVNSSADPGVLYVLEKRVLYKYLVK